MKDAFTMIELVFVIVVLGILAGIALPRLMSPAEDAYDVRLKSDISSIRSAISLARGRNMLRGQSLATNGYPVALDDAVANQTNKELFDGNSTLGTLLTYPIYSSNKAGSWMKTGATKYTAKRGSSSTVSFTYNSANGKFDCNQSKTDCQALTR
jgi:general secretion pathway protein G